MTSPSLDSGFADDFWMLRARRSHGRLSGALRLSRQRALGSDDRDPRGERQNGGAEHKVSISSLGSWSTRMERVRVVHKATQKHSGATTNTQAHAQSCCYTRYYVVGIIEGVHNTADSTQNGFNPINNARICKMLIFDRNHSGLGWADSVSAIRCWLLLP